MSNGTSIPRVHVRRWQARRVDPVRAEARRTETHCTGLHRTEAHPSALRCIDSRRGGFTLIEVLAVIVILGILMIILLPRLGAMNERAKVKDTGQKMALIASAIGQYEGRFGDYPPSQFLDKWGTAPNLTNMGGETLVIGLWSPDWGGVDLPEDLLINSDVDSVKKSLTRFPANELFELKDAWDNPIAYFHHRDYGRADTYVLQPDESEETEFQIKAQMNPKTKSYYQPSKFQLISAGPDGRFGTEDDVVDFKVA
jgi:prepilin-type N-terminal cleavage/methylation domain-containing protein